MKIRGIHHIGVAVRNLEESASRWAALFGAERGAVEEIPERGVRVIPLHFPEGPAVELVSPLGEQSAVARFLEKRGEGIHHVTLDVDDIEDAVEKLRKAGLEFITERPQEGAGGSLIIFVHPKSLNGVLLELREEAE
ncbi:MAG: methylmalonyl-CoA epimerase [Clostridiales bacterium]|nr:methylmalonyl-CoA epimerase [Clostridiales bacterium]